MSRFFTFLAGAFVFLLAVSALPVFSQTATEIFPDGVIFVGTDDGKLNAVDAGSGARKWEYSAGQAIYSDPFVWNGVIYFGSQDKKLHAVDAKTGVRKWEFVTRGEISAAPFVADGVIYFGSQDGKLYAVDALTRVKKWDRTLTAYGAPYVIDGTVFVGADDGKLYALDTTTGEPKWSFATGGRIRSSVFVADGIVYVGSSDQKLYAVDAKTGKQKWEFAAGSTVNSPFVSGGIVYVGSFDKKLYALDAVTGSKKWESETGRGVDAIFAANDRVYFGHADESLYELDSSGNEVLKKLLTNTLRSAPFAGGGMIYTNNGDKKLIALEESGGAQKWEFAASGAISTAPTVCDGAGICGGFAMRGITTSLAVAEVVTTETEEEEIETEIAAEEVAPTELLKEGELILVRDTVESDLTQAGTFSLQSGDILRTDATAVAAVKDRGLGAKLVLTEDTEIEVLEIRTESARSGKVLLATSGFWEDAVESDKSVKLKVKKGAAWFKRRPGPAGFEVQTNTVTATIRGTNFAVQKSATETEEDQVYVLQGEVTVDDQANSESFLVAAGEYFAAGATQPIPTSFYDTELGQYGRNTYFLDVSADTDHFEAIIELAISGIVGGYSDGTFRPLGEINRAELLKILVGGRGVDPDTGKYADCFPDVTTEWFAPYVCYAEEQGWVTGYPDGTFQPASSVNRAEAIKMSVGAFGFTDTGATLPYSDISADAWYAPFVRAAYSQGLLDDASLLTVAAAEDRGGVSEIVYRAQK